VKEEISLDEFDKLPKDKSFKLTFQCICGRTLPLKDTKCKCGLVWKKHPGYMSARVKHGSYQVPT